jgi:hypothetical protein
MKLDKKIERTLNLARRSFFGVIKIYISGKGKLTFESGKLKLMGRISEKTLYMYVSETYTKKIKIKDFSNAKEILSIVKMINENGREVFEREKIQHNFNINKFFENINEFNNKHNLKAVASIISSEDEFLRTFISDIDYRSRFPIIEDYIKIKEGNISIMFPISYLTNEYVKEDKIFIEDIQKASEFNSKNKFKSKVLKWLKKYKKSFPA